jgi:hypothetical protein
LNGSKESRMQNKRLTPKEPFMPIVTADSMPRNSLRSKEKDMKKNKRPPMLIAAPFIPESTILIYLAADSYEEEQELRKTLLSCDEEFAQG